MNGAHVTNAGAPVPDVHVVPIRRTAKWRVHDGDPSVPSSEHPTENDAELAARRRAEERGAERVVIHDRYNRTRQINVARGASPNAPEVPAR